MESFEVVALDVNALAVCLCGLVLIKQILDHQLDVVFE